MKKETEMKMIYVVVGDTVKAYTDKEKAEAEAKRQRYNAECSGSYGRAYVEAVTLED